MDLGATERGNRNELQRAVCRAVLKLRSLQKLCRLEGVRLRLLCPAVQTLGRPTGPGGKVTKEEVESCLYRLFQCVWRELPKQVVLKAVEHTSRLLFKLYDREHTGFVSLSSVEAMLIVLSGDTLSAKHTALFHLACHCNEGPGQPNNELTQNSLRAVLTDLSQVPAAVQESRVFGPVESAVDSCFHGVTSASVSETHFVHWLRSDPQLLLWLSGLERISASEAMVHRVRCHTCKAFPVVGLRFRCLRCLNVHLCQTCFMNVRCTGKHKASHPVLMCCTQPTLREAVALMARSLRHKLTTPLLTRREAEKENTSTVPQLRSHASTPVADDSALDRRPKCENPRAESKAMQTDAVVPAQKKSLLLKRDLSCARWVLRNLQWEKRKLERELQAVRASAQAENRSLKERCCHLEANMEILAHHIQNLQVELGRARQMLEALSNEGNNQSINNIWVSNPEEMTDQPTKERETSSEHTESSRDIETNPSSSEWLLERSCQLQQETVSGRLRHEESQVLEEEGGSELQQKTESVRENLNESDSSEKQEQQLSDLVQRLKDALSHQQETGPVAQSREDLLSAAESVGSSISKLMNTLSMSSPVHQPNMTKPCQTWTSEPEHSGMTFNI